MSDISLDEIQTFAAGLSPWAHLATIGADGDPDVVPIHPAWEGGKIWAMVGADSVKARNVAANPKIAMHWQVTESGDGVEVWGDAEVHTDLETKQRLWTGVFDYDLNDFAPDGPESPSTAFIGITPAKALAIYAYGMKGMKRWKSTD